MLSGNESVRRLWLKTAQNHQGNSWIPEKPLDLYNTVNKAVTLKGGLKVLVFSFVPLMPFGLAACVEEASEIIRDSASQKRILHKRLVEAHLIPGCKAGNI